MEQEKILVKNMETKIIADKKLKKAPIKRTINLFQGFWLLKASGLSGLSSSSPSKAQKPPKGKARIEKISPSLETAAIHM